METSSQRGQVLIELLWVMFLFLAFMTTLTRLQEATEGQRRHVPPIRRGYEP